MTADNALALLQLAVLLLLPIVLRRKWLKCAAGRVSEDLSRTPTGGRQSSRAGSTLEQELGSTLEQELLANKAALATLRAAFLEAGGVEDAHTDIYLLRWLTDGANPAAAAESLAVATRWRAKMGAFEVRSRALAGVPLMNVRNGVDRLLGAMSILPAHRSTRDGAPLNIVVHDDFDPSRVTAALTPEEFLLAMVAMLEYNLAIVDARSAATGRLIRMSFVMDFEGLSYRMISMRFLTGHVKQTLGLDSYYPGLFGAIVCVNAPGIFSMGYKIVKPWLSEDIRDRICVNASGASTAAALDKLASPESLPAAFGGSCVKCPQDVGDAVGWSLTSQQSREMLHARSKLRGYVASCPQQRVSAVAEVPTPTESKVVEQPAISLLAPLKRPWWAACLPRPASPPPSPLSA